jgi:glycosyltransferase involved in cell wall biosynthesis
MKPAVAMVVQRYGEEVNGGAELECRWTAELMKDLWNIEVITTCALDYMTWANYYKAGCNSVNGVTVHRFPVEKERNVTGFNRLSENILGHRHSYADEIEWMKAQGPNSPDLLRYIRENSGRFDLFIFFTYLYGTTFWGLPLVEEKSILVPTAHDEPPIYLEIFKDLFRKPKGFVFNTPEEKTFLINRFNIDCSLSDIIGVGIQSEEIIDASSVSHPIIPGRYVIYVGRIDPSKGCGELFLFWDRYKKRYPQDLTLVLTGVSKMEIPSRPDILPLGFISEQEKHAAISGAECLIMPSPYESLSIALLEAWTNERPVLVNGNCAVLKGQCRRSNGGLWYENYEEFEACLQYILKNRDVSSQMAKNGKRFTLQNYSSEAIQNKYSNLISKFLK